MSNTSFIFQVLYFMRISYKAGKAEQFNCSRESSKHNRLVFTVQNNQLYNIASYLYTVSSLFVLCLVQLDNENTFSVLQYVTIIITDVLSKLIIPTKSFNIYMHDSWGVL